MPYSRKRRYRAKPKSTRRYGVRRFGYRRKTPTALKPEVKSLTVAATPAVNSGGVVQLLNGIPKGTTAYSRVGGKICMRALYVRGFLAVTPSTGVDQLVRIMLVRDRSPTGALPAITDILNASTVYAFPNTDNNTRFRILYDKLLALNASSESGSIRPIKYFKKKIAAVYYNDQSYADVRDIEEGAYYIVALGTSAAGVTAGSLNYNSKFYFTDT